VDIVPAAAYLAAIEDLPLLQGRAAGPDTTALAASVTGPTIA